MSDRGPGEAATRIMAATTYQDQRAVLASHAISPPVDVGDEDPG